MTDEHKEFSDDERDDFEPRQCLKCGHERGKADVVWQEVQPTFGSTASTWLIERVDCPECGRPPVEPGEEWHDQLQ